MDGVTSQINANSVLVLARPSIKQQSIRDRVGSAIAAATIEISTFNSLLSMV